AAPDAGRPGATGVSIGDIHAITPAGLVRYEAHKPGPCGKGPATFAGVEVAGVVSNANGTDRMSIEVRGSYKRVPGPGGALKCDDTHLEPLGESWSESDVPGKGDAGAFRQRIAAPRGQWPCAVSVEVKILRGGQPIARASRTLALGPCRK